MKLSVQSEFKSQTSQFTFYMVLIHLGINYSPLSFGEIVGLTEFFILGMATGLKEGKL